MSKGNDQLPDKTIVITIPGSLYISNKSRKAMGLAIWENVTEAFDGANHV